MIEWLKYTTQFMVANVLELSYVTCDVYVCVIIVLSLLFAHASSPFPFLGIDVVDRCDYLGYGSDCDECFDDEY